MVSFLQQLREKRESRPIRIVFICTANCCRSPIAEILFEKMLMDELGSKEVLAEKKLCIESAATSYSGLSIADKSAQILVKEEGVKASRCNAHRGRLLSEIDEPDLILTMSHSHLDDINVYFPFFQHKVFTLEQFVKADKNLPAYDVKDPIGGTDEDFRRIKNQIKANLTLLIEEFKLAGLL